MATKVTINPNRTQVTAISYGNRTLRGAIDLVLDGAENQFVISYDSVSGNFIMRNVNETLSQIDNGFF